MNEENIFTGGENADPLNSYNAFSQGVELGGLRNTAQIKILMGFIVKSIKGAIKRDKMVEILQLHGLANYFEASQALEELISGGSLALDEENGLWITPKGMAAVNELESEIPRSVRERALNDAIRLRILEKRENENKNNIEVEYLDSGANVTFTVVNGDDVLMKLTVYAADEYQVEKIRDNFLKDPVSIYAGIVSALFT